jgi:hypothetical protein
VDRNHTRQLTYSAFFIAVGILLPMFFHFSGLSGAIFLPMHIPVLLGGLLLGRRFGFMIGLLTPLVSGLCTGMPPLWPAAPMMMVELGLYGMVGGWLYQRLHWPLLAALAGAMAAGRLGMALMVGLFASTLGLRTSPLIYVELTCLHGVPGMLVQLLFIPLTVRLLQRFHQKNGVEL